MAAPTSRVLAAARGLLLFAVWVLLAVAHAQDAIDLPSEDVFAFEPMELPYLGSWKGCLSGSQVAAFEVWTLRSEAWACGRNTYAAGDTTCTGDKVTQWGAIAGIKLSFTDKTEGTPSFITIGNVPDRISDGFLSINPGEYITKVVLTTNGNSDQRLGGITIVTSKGNTMAYTTQTAHKHVCVSGCAYEQTVISQKATENSNWLGSGTFCGLLSQLKPDWASNGISDISFVFLQQIVDARVLNMTFPVNWKASMPALNPISSAMIQLDNRKGPATTLTLSSKQGTTTTGSITITQGSSIAGDTEVKFGLTAPKVFDPFAKGETNIYFKASWDLSTEQETSSSFSNVEVDTDTCKVQVAANSWAKVAFTQYQATYTLPYTGRMKLTFFTGAQIQFDTSGIVSGEAAASASCTACILDSNGCCPAMSKDGCLAPAQTLPRRSLAAVGAGAAELLPLAETAASSSTTSEVSGVGSKHGRQMLQANNPSIWLQSAYMGQKYTEASGVGYGNCLDGWYLATIKAFKCQKTAIYAACGIGLYYSNGYATRTVSLGTTSGKGVTSLGECNFGPNESVKSGTIWNNNRCPGGQCRWGKLELVKSDGTTCSMQVSGFGGGQAARIGPSTRENIGAGLLCGVRGYAGADVDGLALVFMRAVTSVNLTNYSADVASLGVPGPQAFSSSYLDNRLSASGELTTDIELTQTKTQSWREKTSNKMGSQTKFEYRATMFEVLNIAGSASSSYTQTDTIASTGSVLDSSTLKMTVMSPVPSNTCVQITKTRIQGARTGIVFNATRNVLFDNGVMQSMTTGGSTDFNISANWNLNTLYCNSTGLSAQKPSAGVPSAYDMKAPRNMGVDELFKQLSARYGIPVARLKQLNPSLPAKLTKGASIKFVLKPTPLGANAPPTDSASYLLLAPATRNVLLQRVAAEQSIPLKTLQRLNGNRLPVTMKKGSTVKVLLRLPRGRQSG